MRDINNKQRVEKTQQNIYIYAMRTQIFNRPGVAFSDVAQSVTSSSSSSAFTTWSLLSSSLWKIILAVQIKFTASQHTHTHTCSPKSRSLRNLRHLKCVASETAVTKNLWCAAPKNMFLFRLYLNQRVKRSHGDFVCADSAGANAMKNCSFNKYVSSRPRTQYLFVSILARSRSARFRSAHTQTNGEKKSSAKRAKTKCYETNEKWSANGLLTNRWMYARVCVELVTIFEFVKQKKFACVWLGAGYKGWWCRMKMNLRRKRRKKCCTRRTNDRPYDG